MAQLTQHFSVKEMACKGAKCCGHTCAVDYRLMEALEVLRRELQIPHVPDIPLYINSGFRCNKHNKAVGGSKNSQHTKGRAADIKKVTGFTVDEMAERAERVPAFKFGGIIKYDWGIHLDIRKGRYRDDRRTTL